MTPTEEIDWGKPVGREFGSEEWLKENPELLVDNSTALVYYAPASLKWLDFEEKEND